MDSGVLVAVNLYNCLFVFGVARGYKMTNKWLFTKSEKEFRSVLKFLCTSPVDNYATDFDANCDYNGHVQ